MAAQALIVMASDGDGAWPLCSLPVPASTESNGTSQIFTGWYLAQCCRMHAATEVRKRTTTLTLYRANLTGRQRQQSPPPPRRLSSSVLSSQSTPLSTLSILPIARPVPTKPSTLNLSSHPSDPSVPSSRFHQVIPEFLVSPIAFLPHLAQPVIPPVFSPLLLAATVDACFSSLSLWRSRSDQPSAAQEQKSQRSSDVLRLAALAVDQTRQPCSAPAGSEPLHCPSRFHGRLHLRRLGP